MTIWSQESMICHHLSSCHDSQSHTPAVWLGFQLRSLIPWLGRHYQWAAKGSSNSKLLKVKVSSSDQFISVAAPGDLQNHPMPSSQLHPEAWCSGGALFIFVRALGLDGVTLLRDQLWLILNNVFCARQGAGKSLICPFESFHQATLSHGGATAFPVAIWLSLYSWKLLHEIQHWKGSITK